MHLSMWSANLDKYNKTIKSYNIKGSFSVETDGVTETQTLYGMIHTISQM